MPKLREGKARLPNPESVNAFLAEYAPPVLDPFAGGGSIPLEAQRLGLRAYASDLNPVAVIINKALVEIPVKFSNLSPVNPEGANEAGPAGKKGKGRVFSWVGVQGGTCQEKFPQSLGRLVEDKTGSFLNRHDL